MSTVWAQRREELVSDCTVSPDVFHQMVDRLGEFVVPYQDALETETGQHHLHLYLQGLLSTLPRKNAEDIATLVDVERQVLQDFIGTVPWDHRPLITVLVAQVADRLGEPDGIISFDPSSFPKRGIHSVGVKRQWCGHRGKVDNCQVGVFMAYVSRHDHAFELDTLLLLTPPIIRRQQMFPDLRTKDEGCAIPPFDVVPSDVEGFMDALREFQSPFHDCFARSEPRAHFFDYMVGPLSALERKSREPMALALEGGNIRGMQRFISDDSWDEEQMRWNYHHLVAEALGAPHGVVMFAATGFVTKGKESAGVARHYWGALGQVEPCQVGGGAA